MKVAILTFIRAYNHGAVLQCYALHKKLRDLGIDNEVLDYNPTYFRKVYNLEHISKWRWFPGSYVERTPKFIHMKWRLRKRNRNFGSFIQTNIRLSKKQFLSPEQINQGELSYQAYLVGSDQVWHPTMTEGDPVFFADFPAAQKARKLSYAASFGVSEIPDEFRDEYIRRLQGWESYSVREESGAKILSDLLGIQSSQCCDPTLLLEKRDWEIVMKKPKSKAPYILIYYVSACKKLIEKAKQLAAETGCKLVALTSAGSYEQLMGTYEKEHSIQCQNTAGPDEFLGLFSNAEYVLTDSFHGTVFSLMFHRPFLTLTDQGWAKNNRASDLLEYLELEDRILEHEQAQIEKSVPWDQVDEKLREYRERSVDYLKHTFEVR